MRKHHIPPGELREQLAGNPDLTDIEGELRKLDDLLSYFEIPAPCLPSLLAASRSLRQAIAHVEAACAVADHLAQQEVR